MSEVKRPSANNSSTSSASFITSAKSAYLDIPMNSTCISTSTSISCDSPLSENSSLNDKNLDIYETTHGKHKLSFNGYYYNLDSSVTKIIGPCRVIKWKCEFGHRTKVRNWTCNGRVESNYFYEPVRVITPHHEYHYPDFSRVKNIAINTICKKSSIDNEDRPRTIIKKVQSLFVSHFFVFILDFLVLILLNKNF